MLDLRQAIPQRQTRIVEIAFDRPLGQMVRWNTDRKKYAKPPPPFLIGLHQELPTGESTLPGRIGAEKTVPEMQRMKPCGIQHLIPVVGETAEAAMGQPSIRCKPLKPGEMVMPEKTRIPYKHLLLAGILTGILIFSGILTGILILAGILTGILILAGTPESEETDISEETLISDGAQTVSRRTQIRLRKRHQRRNWIVYRKPRE